MRIKVNGNYKYLNIQNQKISLSNVMSALGYKENTVVVELNNLIINSEGWGNSYVKEEDSLEIVSIVGGG